MIPAGEPPEQTTGRRYLIRRTIAFNVDAWSVWVVVLGLLLVFDILPYESLGAEGGLPRPGS